MRKVARVVAARSWRAMGDAGAFAATDVPGPRLPDELSRLSASECLFADSLTNIVTQAAGPHLPKSRVARPDWTFDPSTAFAISRLTDSGYLNQSPIGVFRQVERPTYDDQARAQVTTAQERNPEDATQRLAALIGGGDTWTVV